MAEKLSVQIELKGGEEIAKQLEGIGEAGQKAFADIAKSAEQVGGFNNIKPEEVTAKLQEMGVTGVDSIKKIQQAVKSAGRLEGLVQGVSSVETAFVALGRAAGPVGLAIAAAMSAAAKATFAFAETLSKASDEAVKLGQTLQQFEKGKKFFEDLGISSGDAAAGVRAMAKAGEGASFDNVRKAAAELKDFGARGFGAQGTAQLKILEQAARGAGEEAQFARKTLLELGQPIPTNAAKTLQEFTRELGSNEAGMAAFKRQLQQMPDGLDRTDLAIGSLGEKAGTAFVQSMRAAEGSMSAAELKAYNLQTALNGLNTTAGKFGTVALAPTLTAGIDLMNTAVQALNDELERSPWSVFASGAQAAFNPVGFLAGLATTAIIKFGSALGGIVWDSISSAGVAAWNAIVSAAGTAKNAVLEFAASLPGITWDAITSAAAAAWAAVKQGAADAKAAVLDFAASLTGIAWDAFKQAGVAAWNAIIAKVKEFLGLKPQVAPATGGSAPGKARGGLLGGRGSGTSDSNLAWVSRGEHIMPAGVVRRPGVLAFLEALRRSGKIPGFAAGGSIGSLSAFAFAGGLTQVIESLKQLAQSVFRSSKSIYDSLIRLGDEIVTNARSVFNTIDGIAQAVTNNSNQTTEALSTAAFALQNILNQGGMKARGGLLGGRGSGTSDSNLAWVSRGEYITPARAVAQPGVLAFLEALRRSGGNLRSVLDGMGRFALGGMIRSPMPAFAGGGMVGGHLGTLTLGLPSGGSVTVRASAGVADELRREAALAQVRSGGRKPSRYS